MQKPRKNLFRKEWLPFLREILNLLHLADSALPIGGAAHSFGLESLVEDGLLDVENLERFLMDYLQETGVLEAWYCATSCRLTRITPQLGARKPARESREGSAALGRRFLQLAAAMSKLPLLEEECARLESDTHLASVFGFVAGALGFNPELTATAFLQQSMWTLISCCQRLLPLGQTRAHQILWSLKPAMLETISAAVSTPEARCFTPLLDIGSARHPNLATRLFIS